MAGKRQRSSDQLVDRRPQRARPLTVVASIDAFPPEAPPDIADEAVLIWNEFWSSPLAGAVTWSAHREALEHWIRCVSQRHKLWEAWTKQPLIRGSHEQWMTNPLYRQIRSLNEEIHRAEEQFGMTPLAQLRLGVTFLQERSLASNLKVSGERRKPSPYKPPPKRAAICPDIKGDFPAESSRARR